MDIGATLFLIGFLVVFGFLLYPASNPAAKKRRAGSIRHKAWALLVSMEMQN